jgi:hypothetical protein
MRKGIVWKGLVAVGLALGAATASADDFIGFYAGGGIGSSSVDDDFALDDSDTGFKAFVGYSLGEFVAVELAYMDGGTLKDTMDFGFFATNVEADPRIINASVVGNLQLTEQFALIGRLGYASIDLDLTGTAGGPLIGGTVDISDDGSEEEISYGAGAVYTIGETFQLRAEYEAFDVPNGTIDFISVSALFRFRL